MHTLRYYNKPSTERKAPSNIKRGLAVCAISGFAALSPIHESMAEEAQHTVVGTQVQLTAGTSSVTAYAVVRQSDLFPVLEIEGPATFTVNYYPVVRRDRFTESTSEIPWSIDYSLNEVGTPQDITNYRATIRLSAFTTSEIDQATLVIGTPIELALSIPAGRYRFSVVYPNGFLEVVDVEEEIPLVPIGPPPIDIDVEVADETPQREPTSEEPEDARAPFVSLQFRRTTFTALGQDNNIVDINGVDIPFTPRLNDTLRLIVGPSMDWNNIALSNNEITIRSISVTLDGGLLITPGNHTILLAISGGINILTPQLRTDDEHSEYTAIEGEFTGRVGYDYNNMFGLMLQGGTNPLSVGSLNLYASVPYTWAEDAYPRLDVDARWLHLMRSNTSEEGIDFSLDQNEFVFDTRLSVPVVYLGPILPRILAGFRWDSDFQNGVNADAGDIYLGATLSGTLANRVYLELGGTGSFNADYMLLLNVGILR
ncbi:hypothetical protein KKB44_01825 [Candidatus Micrarchaeota archaeon]|nr:hypothetical protein [Candidatus Micrarchaeota archaeon]